MPVAYGLIEPINVSLPTIPPATDGLRIALVTDPHVTRRTPLMERLASQLTSMRLDLVFFGGDYVVKPGDEDAAFDVLGHLCEKLRPNLGIYGVFGNHDTAELRDRCTALPIHWLDNQSHRLPDHPIEVLGLGGLGEERPDAIKLLLNRPWPPDPGEALPVGSNPAPHAAPHLAPHAVSPDADRRQEQGRSGRGTAAPGPNDAAADAQSPPQPPLRLLLCHFPGAITTAADLDVDLMFSGHTHGGQIRLPGGHALITSSDLPRRFSAGLLKHRRTLAVVSRGLGVVGFPRLRLFCRPHVPVVTLHRRSTPGLPSEHVTLLEKW